MFWRIWFNRFCYWNPTVLVPVTVRITDGIHKRKMTVYYRKEKHSHRKH